MDKNEPSNSAGKDSRVIKRRIMEILIKKEDRNFSEERPSQNQVVHV